MTMKAARLSLASTAIPRALCACSCALRSALAALAVTLGRCFVAHAAGVPAVSPTNSNLDPVL